MPQLVAMFAALVFSHTEATATEHTTQTAQEPEPEPAGKRCGWCNRLLPPGVHHSQKYCPETDCARLAYNVQQKKRYTKRKKKTA